VIRNLRSGLAKNSGQGRTAGDGEKGFEALHPTGRGQHLSRFHFDANRLHRRYDGQATAHECAPVTIPNLWTSLVSVVPHAEMRSSPQTR